jgi:hypothetical protein
MLGRRRHKPPPLLGSTCEPVQRWLSQPEVKGRLVAIQNEAKAIAQLDPVVVSVVDIRGQAQEI